MSKAIKILLLSIAALFATPDTPESLDSSIYSYSVAGSFSSDTDEYRPTGYSAYLFNSFQMHFLKSYSFDIGTTFSLQYYRELFASFRFNLGATKYFIQDSHGPYFGLGLGIRPAIYANYPMYIHSEAYTQIGYLFQIKDHFYFDIKYQFIADTNPSIFFDRYSNYIFLGISQYF